MDTTNDLFRGLIKVLVFDILIETCMESVNKDKNDIYYQSPSKIYSRINLHYKKAIKIKQKLKVDWSRALKKRSNFVGSKETMHMMLNSMKNGKANTYLLSIPPRKYKISKIHEEMKEQKNIRANNHGSRAREERNIAFTHEI